MLKGKVPKVGHNNNQSETLIPQYYTSPQTPYCYLDTAGFFDTREDEHKRFSEEFPMLLGHRLKNKPLKAIILMAAAGSLSSDDASKSIKEYANLVGACFNNFREAKEEGKEEKPIPIFLVMNKCSQSQWINTIEGITEFAEHKKKEEEQYIMNCINAMKDNVKSRLPFMGKKEADPKEDGNKNCMTFFELLGSFGKEEEDKKEHWVYYLEEEKNLWYNPLEKDPEEKIKKRLEDVLKEYPENISGNIWKPIPPQSLFYATLEDTGIRMSRLLSNHDTASKNLAAVRKLIQETRDKAQKENNAKKSSLGKIIQENEAKIQALELEIKEAQNNKDLKSVFSKEVTNKQPFRSRLHEIILEERKTGKTKLWDKGILVFGIELRSIVDMFTRRFDVDYENQNKEEVMLISITTDRNTEIRTIEPEEYFDEKKIVKTITKQKPLELIPKKPCNKSINLRLDLYGAKDKNATGWEDNTTKIEMFTRQCRYSGTLKEIKNKQQEVDLLMKTTASLRKYHMNIESLKVQEEKKSKEFELLHNKIKKTTGIDDPLISDELKEGLKMAKMVYELRKKKGQLEVRIALLRYILQLADYGYSYLGYHCDKLAMYTFWSDVVYDPGSNDRKKAKQYIEKWEKWGKNNF